ncbi:UBIQUITIN-40S ribosomal protein S31 [Anaeramoeba ignava]|uniref:UBIQUITIN-40S ribosomal protein S31 n=1 Tax=Anaeramoeba ignava TaxID=1746090 RepID=A0A9Q0RB63_ANAIG|nr:UBIQUITIN-40S ribosomal protein S31 [Anaeramoeba ignava]
MKITVKTLKGWEMDCEISSNDDVLVLMQQVEVKEGTSINRQKLSFQGQILQQGNTISSYNIQEGSRIYLISDLL